MEYLIELLGAFTGPTAYALVFGVLLLCGFGLPIPEDVTLIAAGLIAFEGGADIWTMILVSFAGVMVGDSIVFLLGAKYGRKLTRRWFFAKILPPDRLDVVRGKFNEKGLKLLFAARFMPGLRAPIFFSAGTFHIPYSKLLIYDGGAALLSVPAIVGAVYHFGPEIEGLIKKIEGGILAVILLAILLVIGKWYITHRKLKRARRLT